MGVDIEVIFTVDGSIEIFEDDGTMREIMDLFSFWRMYSTLSIAKQTICTLTSSCGIRYMVLKLRGVLKHL